MPVPMMSAIEKRTAPIIVTAEMGVGDQVWAEGLRRRHYPAERNYVPAHITLLRHLSPSLEGELRTLLREFARKKRPMAAITGVRMVNCGVIIGLHSPDLLALWSQMAARFERHLTPPDLHEPRLHITIQNKVSEAAARATVAMIEASLVLRPVSVAALACWSYGGGPWSLIGRYPFRG